MRSQYPEIFKFRAPAGFIETVTQAASREGLSTSAYLRRLALLDARQSAERSDAHGVNNS